ncbi:MAG: DUF362 domain-containing protein [Nitrospinota bacterium]|nr:DUF362 domain-containing protein [Nitrospinota bacterium]
MTSKYNKKDLLLDRRQFIKKSSVVCGGALGAGAWGYLFYSKEPVRKIKSKIYSFKDYRVPVSNVYAKMTVARGTDLEKMLRVSVEKLGGITKFIQPGDKVLIKPNVGWDRQPEQAANTNPELVSVIVKLCREAKASQIGVTDVSINDPYRCFARSGIENAAVKAGGKILFTGDNDFVLTDMKGELLKVWPVSKFYHQFDKVINVPIVKNHSLSKCTLAMKNWYGVLGGQRNQLHQDINNSIADLARAVRPTLTIMDATRVLKKNGPTGGNLSDVSVENTIVAGLDEVAIDSYCLQFLDLKIDDVPYIKIAEQRGLGTSDWNSIKVEEINLV